MTAEGEAILADLDDWLINYLRTHKLVWSGWDKEERRLSSEHFDVGPDPTGRGIRIFNIKDAELFGRALMSIVWRTCASQLPDMAEARVKASTLRRMRATILSQRQYDYNLMPFTLVQLTSKGDIHNHSPILMRRPIGSANRESKSATIIRYYFDGLVIHAFPPPRRFDPSEFGGLILSEKPLLGVIGVPFEESLQKDILNEAVMLSMLNHPDAKPFKS